MFHEVFIFALIYSQKMGLYFSQYNIVVNGIGTFGAATLTSLLISLLFEAPLGNLQREFLEGGSAPPVKRPTIKDVATVSTKVENLNPMENKPIVSIPSFPIPVRNAEEILNLFNSKAK